MDRQTLRDWVHRYNEFGPEGLNDRPKSGRKVFLDESQLKAIWLEKGPETDGLVRWRVQDVKNKIQTNFGVKYSMEGTRRLMQRLGFRHVSPRPIQAKPKDKFRENFQDIVKDVVGPDKVGRTAWFQDEGRIGQKGMLARLWARKNSRPRIACDHRYGYVYLFGAACAERMLAVGHIAGQHQQFPLRWPPLAEGASRQHRCRRASRRDPPGLLRLGADIALTILFPLKNLLRHTRSRRWLWEFPLLARTQSVSQSFRKQLRNKPRTFSQK